MRNNKILIITQYFFPENFKSNDLAFDLQKAGYKVHVLTGIPNYPEGEYYKGYNIFQRRIETINGVKVFRSFQMPRGKNNKIKLILNYLTFAFFASIWALFLCIFYKYRCVIVHEPSPITQGIPAVLVKKIQKIPLYFWVLDIWPDAMKSGGGVTNQTLLSLAEKVTIFIYNNCTKILISSKGFKQLIMRQGNYEDKIIYYPNWSDDILKMDDSYPIPELPKGFKILLAGNLGKSQNLDAVMNAANELRDVKDVKWLFVGDGSRKNFIDSFISEHNLQETVFTYGKYPMQAMPAFYKNANALLITLKGEFPHLKMVVPARLQTYMASGRPIIGMISGGSADLVKEANCGFVVESGNFQALSTIIKDVILTDKGTFESLGINGRKYYEENFTKEKCINNLIAIIESNSVGNYEN